MYQHILIATDGTDLAMNAVHAGAALARSVGAKVTVVTVSEPVRWWGPAITAATDAAIREGSKQVAETALNAASDAAKVAGVDCDRICVEDEFPYRGIVDTAEGKNCDLIVMASHGRRGVSAVLLGSETVKVLTHSKIPVLVCH
jgi:nucleotide-binding universal stress UspA family protein